MAEFSQDNPVLAAAPALPASAPNAPPDAAQRDRFIGHAHWMSFLTILSRCFGLLRDKIWSTYLGLGWEFSAFWQGFQFPNLFRRVFGEGALTAVFVPIYTRVLHEKGPDAANRLVQATSTQLVLLLARRDRPRRGHPPALRAVLGHLRTQPPPGRHVRDHAALLHHDLSRRAPRGDRQRP